MVIVGDRGRFLKKEKLMPGESSQIPLHGALSRWTAFRQAKRAKLAFSPVPDLKDVTFFGLTRRFDEDLLWVNRVSRFHDGFRNDEGRCIGIHAVFVQVAWQRFRD